MKIIVCVNFLDYGIHVVATIDWKTREMTYNVNFLLP